MATYTPPPYFPQGSLSPPDEKRYRKFKLAVAALIFTIAIVLSGLGFGLWYLVKWVF